MAVSGLAALLPPGGWPSVSAELRTRLEAGLPLLLVGRQSTAGGRKSARETAEDMWFAAEGLQAQTGLVVTPLLPSVEEMAERLAAVKPQMRLGSEGKKVSHRFCELDLRPAAPVVLLLITGSGRALDANHTQPVVERIAQAVRQHKPAALVAKRFDRLARADWAFGPAATALNETGTLLGHQDAAPRPFDEVGSLLAFIQGGEGGRQARQLVRQTRQGQRKLSATQMEQGRAVFRAAGGGAPPGFATAYLDDGSGGRGLRVLFIDTPAFRPAAAEATFGLPQVFDAEGQPVDQAATVRWVLARLGKPEWPYTRLTAELAQRHYSTEHLRNTHRDPAATFTGGEDGGRSLLTRIIANLELYETGVFTRELGAGEPPMVIKGCWPPPCDPAADGPGQWASVEDFARIRTRQREWRQRQDRKTTLTFAGAHARYNGEPVLLLTTPRRRDRGDTAPRYRFCLTGPYQEHRQCKTPPGHLMVPWQALHDSVIDAIRDAGELPLTLADLVGADPDVARKQADAEQAANDLAAARRRLEGLEAQLTETDAHGQLLVSGALLKRLDSDYNTLVEQHIPELERHARHAQQALDQARAPATGVQTRQMLTIVEELGQPQSRLLRTVLPAAICDLQLTTRKGHDGVGRYGEVEWHATLRFDHDDHGPYQLPIHGRWRTNGQQLTRVISLVDEHLERLRDGQPWPDQDTSNRAGLTRLLADRLTPGQRTTPLLLACTDPTITAIATRLHLDPDRSDADLASDLACPETLIARVRHTHLTQPRAHWQQPPHRALAALYELAVANNGTVLAGDAAAHAGVSKQMVWNAMSQQRAATDLWATHRKHGYQLRACACGALAWTLPDTPEPHHAICGGCHHDLAGLPWTPPHYRHYHTAPPDSTEPNPTHTRTHR